MLVWFWLGLIILFLVIEAVTVGLATIWFAAGALAALLVSLCGVGILGQMVVFFLVSMALLFFTRPVAVKYFDPHKIRTNYEDAVDKTVKITERVDNIGGTGAALLNGQEWTARAAEDGRPIPAGTLVQVKEIRGVKLIVAEQQA